MSDIVGIATMLQYKFSFTETLYKFVIAKLTSTDEDLSLRIKSISIKVLLQRNFTPMFYGLSVKIM